MIDRKELAEEVMLREHIRQAIQVIKGRRIQQQLAESHAEKELRNLIRSLLPEAKKIATYDNTGKNELNIFLLNTSFLSTLETTYRKLTSTYEQRSSYIDHIVNAVTDLLGRIDSIEQSDDAPVQDEKIKISVGDDDPANDPDFMGDALAASDDEPEKLAQEPGEIEFEKFAIKGKDMTGARNAYADFKNTKDIIRQAYDTLDEPEDQDAFRDELPTQIILYAKAWENSLRAEVEVPEEIEDAAGGDLAPSAPAPEVEEEDEVAAIELQELIRHLDVDDIIKNLL